LTQATFPEIESATAALQSRIALTEAEVVELKESIRTKKALLRTWRKALSAFASPPSTRKKKATAV
jgi:hypothetical protein